MQTQYDLIENPPSCAESVARLWSWSENYDYPTPATLFLDLIGYSDEEIGEPLFDMPADRVTLNARVHGANAGNDDAPWYVGAGSLLVRRQDGVPNGTVYTLPTAGYALLQLEAGLRGQRMLGRRADVSLSVNNALNTRYRDYLSRYRLFANDTGRDVVARVTMPW